MDDANSNLEKSGKSKKGRGKPKGLPKSGGRLKGTPNKNSLNFKKALDKAGLNLVAEIVALINTIENPMDKLAKLQALLPYTYARLAEAQEMPKDASEGQSGPMTPEDRLKLIRGGF